jgi:hypothetical protein
MISEKLHYKIRESAGRRIREPFKLEFFEKTGILFDNSRFLNIKQSDLLKDKFCNMFATGNDNNFTKIIKTKDILIISEKLKKLFENIQASCLTLFLRNAYHLGAIKINAREVYQHFENILDLDGDTIFILSEDLENGIDLTFYEENENTIYEVTVFGIIWFEFL